MSFPSVYRCEHRVLQCKNYSGQLSMQGKRSLPSHPHSSYLLCHTLAWNCYEVTQLEEGRPQAIPRHCPCHSWLGCPTAWGCHFSCAQYLKETSATPFGSSERMNLQDGSPAIALCLVCEPVHNILGPSLLVRWDISLTIRYTHLYPIEQITHADWAKIQ